MSPLQCHYIYNPQSTSMKSKEKHFKKLFSAWFLTGFVIFHESLHLFFIQTLTVKFTLFLR